jgi:hypothetical protein
LELDSVATGGYRNRDQALCDIQITVMVNTDLGHNVAGLTIADLFVTNLYRLISDSHPTLRLCHKNLRIRVSLWSNKG